MADRTATKNLIAQSFIELSKIKNIDKITIKDIIEHCGLPRTTFYNHFQDKYALIVWIYDFRNYSSANRRFLINAIKHNSGQNSFLNQVSRIHFETMYEVMSGGGRLPLRIEQLLKLYIFGTVQLSCEWLIKKMPISINEFATILATGLPAELAAYIPSSKAP